MKLIKDGKINLKKKMKNKFLRNKLKLKEPELLIKHNYFETNGLKFLLCNSYSYYVKKGLLKRIKNRILYFWKRNFDKNFKNI